MNKVDISNVNNIKNYFRKGDFNKKMYLRWNIELNKKILKKCKKCFFMKKCHEEILLWEDANILDKDIVNYIWNSLIYSDIIINNKKRENLLNNIIKWNI